MEFFESSPNAHFEFEETFARRSNMHARQIAQILAADRVSSRPFEEAYNVGRYILHSAYSSEGFSRNYQDT
jgi:hypothetical protein